MHSVDSLYNQETMYDYFDVIKNYELLMNKTPL